MVTKSECAWNCQGNCRLCGGSCKVEHDAAVCPEAVRRAVHHSMRGLTVRERNMVGARNFHRHVIEKARGRDVYFSCRAKRRFRDETQAAKKGRQMARRYGVLSRVYYCRYCNGYHLTTKACRSQCESLLATVAA